MSDTTNEHAQAIREIAQNVWNDHPEDDDTLLPKVRGILDHADALAAQIAEAEARAIEQEHISGRIFRELMEMRAARTDEEAKEIFDRAADVFNGIEAPDGDLDAADPEGQP